MEPSSALKSRLDALRLLENLHLIREGFAPILIGPQEKPRYFEVLERSGRDSRRR